MSFPRFRGGGGLSAANFEFRNRVSKTTQGVVIQRGFRLTKGGQYCGLKVGMQVDMVVQHSARLKTQSYEK